MKKPFYKRWWFIVLMILLAISIIGSQTENSDNQDEEKVTVNAPANNETKSKEKEEKQEKEQAEDTPNADDVAVYNKSIIGQFDAFQKEFDAHWDNNWVATFNGISDGTVDVYTAYSNLNTLDKYYAGLSNKIRKVELPKLSKENQEYVDAYLKHLKSSSNYRGIAAADAAKMIDEGNVKPSVMEDIQSIVESSNNELMQAAINRTQLEMNLGLIEE